MSPLDDRQLDHLLHRHLSRELDGRAGRAMRYFHQHLAQRRPAWKHWWFAASAAGGLAAALAAAWLLAAPRGLNAPGSAGAPSTHAQLPAQPPLISEIHEPEPLPVSQTLVWRTLDEGPVLLHDDIPARFLRHQSVQHVQWYDPARHAIIEMAIPREQTILIEMARY